MRFNIDTRSVVESSWIYDERINDRGIIFKSIDMTDPGGAEYRKTMLRVSCLGSDQLMVGYAREVGPKENSFIPLKFVAAKQEFKLAPPAEPVSGNTVSKRYDIRRAPVPMRAFEFRGRRGPYRACARPRRGQTGRDQALHHWARFRTFVADPALQSGIAGLGRRGIGPAPGAIAPGQPPSRRGGRLARDKIEARRSPRLAAQHTR